MHAGLTSPAGWGVMTTMNHHDARGPEETMHDLPPVAWIGHRVEVRETRDKIEIEMDARHIVTHARSVTPLSQRVTIAAHRVPRGEGVKRSDPHPEEKAIVEAAPETALYVAALRQKGPGISARTVPRGWADAAPAPARRSGRSPPTRTSSAAPSSARWPRRSA